MIASDMMSLTGSRRRGNREIRGGKKQKKKKGGGKKPTQESASRLKIKKANELHEGQRKKERKKKGGQERGLLSSTDLPLGPLKKEASSETG